MRIGHFKTSQDDILVAVVPMTALFFWDANYTGINENKGPS